LARDSKNAPPRSCFDHADRGSCTLSKKSRPAHKALDSKWTFVCGNFSSKSLIIPGTRTKIGMLLLASIAKLSREMGVSQKTSISAQAIGAVSKMVDKIGTSSL